MTQAKGSQAQLVGGIKETTFGSDPASPSGVVLPIISSDISLTQPNIDDDVLRGNRNAAKPSKGNKAVSGSVVAPLDITGIGYWLQMALGDPTTTGSGPYTHVFKVPSSLDSWVLEQGYADITQYQKFNGCKVNSLAFNFDAAANTALQVSAQVEGASLTQGTSSIDGSASAISLTRFEIDDLALTEGGSSIANVRSLSLTIGNNLDTNNYVVGGSGVRGSLPEGKCTVAGTITTLFENTTLLTKALNSTETAIVATLTSGSYSLELDIGELIYGFRSPGIPGPQGILVSLDFTGYYDDDADASAIKATLVNGTATYPS